MRPPARVAAVVVAVASALSGCASSRAVGLVPHSLVSGGVTRVWYDDRPAVGSSGRLPTLILLGGYHEQAADLPYQAGLSQEAARDGFALVAPEGVELSWNAGGCCGVALARHVDDVRFLADLIALLVDRGLADPARIYLAGFSNGAMMTYTFACDHPELLAGAVVVAGTLTAGCGSHTAINLLVIHQTGDGVVPYAGTAHPDPALGAAAFVSVPSALATWLGRGGCPATGDFRPPVVSGTVARTKVSCPNGSTTSLVVLAGGGHVWPTASTLNATDELARFFHLRSR